MGKAMDLATIIRKFRTDSSGTVAIIFGIAVIPTFLAIGVATDYIRAGAVQSRLQATLDSATLAAASSKTITDAQRIDLATAMFVKNWQSDAISKDIKATPKFEISNGFITGSAKIEMPTAIMQLAGINSMDIGSDVTVTIPGEKKAEIVLVLDYSESMTEVSGGKVKYIAMRDAANKLIGDLNKEIPDKIKVGLVPFSHHVYVTLPKSYVLGQTGTGNWTGCTQDRKYPYNLDDTTPISTNDSTKWGQPQAPDHISYGCSAYPTNNLKVLPLTTDINAVTQQLNKMKPYAFTHIALGVEFGFHVLSPNAPFSEGAEYTDKQTQKFMVVLTDGRQTEPAFGKGSTRTVTQGEKNLVSLCQATKDKGITMITVAFDLDDQATKDRLSQCSSDPSKYFFIAEDDAEVAKAFEDIKKQITAQVFLSK